MNTKMGIDCASPISASFASTLIHNGDSFVCRYMVPMTKSSSWKRLGPNEVKILSDAKLSILSIFELGANRAGEGETAGAEDGKSALNEAISLGMPKSGCIYFAVDYEANSSQFDEIAAYLKAAKSQIGRYKIGVYGSYAVIEAMYARGICDCYWQTYAWSYGKISKHANVYQYKNDIIFAGVGVDLNKSFGNEGFWNLNVNETWEEILNSVSESSKDWNSAVTMAMTAAKNTNLGSLGIFRYLGSLIEKIDKLKYTGTLSWMQIIEKVSGNQTEWKIAINAAVGAAGAEGNLGTLEIFKFLPQLIVKIYESNK